MNRIRMPLILWPSCLIAGGLGVAGLILWTHNRAYLPVSAVVSVVAFPTLGALIATRRPENRIGWIFCAIGVLYGLWLLVSQYAIYAIHTEPGSVPGPAVAAWLSSWIWAPPIWLTGTICILLFPDGRLPSSRWRPIPWLAGGGFLLFIGALSLTPWDGRESIAAPPQLDAAATGVLGVLRPLLAAAIAATPSELQGGVTYPIDNPLALPVEAKPVLAVVAAVGAVLILASFVGTITAPIIRFRHARGPQRQQLKWIAYAAALIALIYLLTNTRVPRLTDWALAVNLSLFPFAVAIAILRHHMYDIDLVIRRTLVYGLVSGILGLGYAGTVLILGQLFGGVSRDAPSWAIAASTLTVAALFQPVRRRIQHAVDRRFNRRRHDASQAIAAFADRLHQQLDLDALSSELLEVVGQTMEPTTASLWLRQRQRSAS